jgi:ferredoxin-NADP reductase
VIRPSVHKAKIKDKSLVTHKVTKLILSYTTPDEMEFTPGQFINLKCPGGHYRAYSISSDYKNQKEMYVLIETGHEGVASNYVKSLKVGDEIEFIGPSGRLSLLEPLPDTLKFFATGTGIAPFISMFHRLVDMQYKGSVELFLGSRTEKEILEQMHIKMFAKQLPNFKYTFYVSRPEGGVPAENIKFGHVTDALNYLDNFSNDFRYYVCGHPSMVEEVESTLELNGIELKNVIVEEFTYSHS